MRAKAEIIERQDGRGYPQVIHPDNHNFLSNDTKLYLDDDIFLLLQVIQRRGVEGKLNISRSKYLCVEAQEGGWYRNLKQKIRISCVWDTFLCSF